MAWKRECPGPGVWWHTLGPAWLAIPAETNETSDGVLRFTNHSNPNTGEFFPVADQGGWWWDKPLPRPTDKTPEEPE